VGAVIPDYRGVFLRGHGSVTSGHYGTVVHLSGNLGELQGDAIRPLQGSLTYVRGPNKTNGGEGVFQTSGAPSENYYGGGLGGQCNVAFDASHVAPVAKENRPVNRAVAYLIRAR